MRKDSTSYLGIEKLVDKYKKAFRIPENLNYYSKKDYKIAERKFIKNAVLRGKINSSDIQSNHISNY